LLVAELAFQDACPLSSFPSSPGSGSGWMSPFMWRRTLTAALKSRTRRGDSFS
jgi:hypothetical protein